MKLAYDLHIHSILSPCADTLMTPNNILNMAMLKELDILAITDHNSLKQLKVIENLSESYDFLIIPAVEVTVKENFDVLCYFRTFEDAYKFDSYLEKHLNGAWGNYSKEDQVITDIYDNTLIEYDTPLVSTDITYKDLHKEVKQYGGIVILAHVERNSKSALMHYKLRDIEFDGIEIHPYTKEQYLKNNPHLNEFRLFHNSDAHTLMQILEKDSFIELEEKTIQCFFKYFGE
jgi:predicted metal-dependent phosphoesterase TrpH